MARRKLSHLETRGGIYWVRIAVPRDLCNRLQRREWKFSLRTREPRIAKLKCLEATLAIERLQVIVRSMPTLTDAQIIETARAYLGWALRHAATATETRAHEHLLAANDIIVPSVADERAGLEEGLRKLREDCAAHRQDWAAEHLASGFARDRNIDFKKLDEDSRAALLHVFQRARIEEYRIRLAQIDGNYADAVARDPLFADMVIPLRANWTNPTKAPDVPSLRAAAERFRSSKMKSGEWVAKTVKDNSRVLGWFMELNDPEQPISEITTADIRDYIDALNDLPANVIKMREYNGKTLREILALSKKESDGDRLSQATRAKYFSKLKSFFTWCEEQEYIKSPVGKLTVAEPRNAKEQRLPFSREQLKTYFSSPQYSGHATPERRSKPGKLVVRDGKFWIPLIGLYSGMRLGEIVQLLLADVREVDGVWCFEVSRTEEDEAGPKKNIKTASSLRLVPIHPTLVGLGFLQFVDIRRAKGKRLFDEIKPGKDGYYSHNFSKYFSRYLASIGIKTKKTSFHSFRHNFADACDRGSVTLPIREALMGHADDSVAGRYGSAKYPTDVLLENISRIKLDVHPDWLPEAVPS